MRIEIDTSADSKDSIKKVIRLLHDLTDEPLSNYSLSQSSPLPAPSQASPSEGFFNLFGPADAPASPPAQAPLAQSTAPASQDGFFDIFKTDGSSQAQPPSSRVDPYEDSVSRTIDEEYDDLARLAKKRQDSAAQKAPEVRKKFQLPEDQISVIEY
ncbi:MAG: hypothetical protein AABX47_08660 [Nanoarchaeota archaeon]|mgnify:CR=1 FL=1